MAGQQSRILAGGKDMLWAVGGLALIVMLIAGMAGQCSFSPGAPEAGPVQRFDVSAGLSEDAARLNFPIRNPTVPEGWIPNSGNKNAVGDAPATTVGYVTAGRRYVSLTQTSATEESVVSAFAPGEPASGAQSVSGISWIVYPGSKNEPVWVADVGKLRVALRGTASQDEFTQLATAFAKADPISR